MSNESRFDSVGWGFFGLVWLISVVPVFYGILHVTHDSTPMTMRVASSAFIAGFLAAVLSWIANSILGAIADRRDATTETSANDHTPKNK